MALHIYNGYQLPELPDWDKSTYPYAVILKALVKDGFLMICHSTRPYMKELDGKMVLSLDPETKLYGFVCTDKDTSWGSGDVLDASDLGEEETNLLYYIWGNSLYVWSNEDIYDEDGVVYYPYTAPESYCEKSFQIGISIGMSIS